MGIGRETGAGGLVNGVGNSAGAIQEWLLV